MTIIHDHEQKHWGQYTRLDKSASKIRKNAMKIINALEKYREELQDNMNLHKEICKEMREKNQNPSMHSIVISAIAEALEKEINVVDKALKMFKVMVHEFWTINRYVCDTHKEEKEDYEQVL